MTTTLDLTGGRLNVRVNPGDGETFVLTTSTDLSAWTWTTVGGLTVTVSGTQATVRIPASVTATVGTLPSQQPAYAVRVQQGAGDPVTLISGRLTL